MTLPEYGCSGRITGYSETGYSETRELRTPAQCPWPREGEVAFTEYNDLDFKANVLHIQPKPDRGFRLKGKKNGDKSTQDRFVLLPALMAKLQRRMKNERVASRKQSGL